MPYGKTHNSKVMGSMDWGYAHVQIIPEYSRNSSTDEPRKTAAYKGIRKIPEKFPLDNVGFIPY
jgi:hypothetical protein